MNRFLFFLIILFFSSTIFSQPGKDGAQVISSTNKVVNYYWPLSSNLSAGSNTVSLANSNTVSLCPGDLVMIYQAQGASLNFTNTSTSTYGDITSYNSAGYYEFQYVQSVSGNILTTQTTFTNSYFMSGRPQIIKVPQYTTLTINSGASIVPKEWKDTVISSISYRFGGLVVVHASSIVNNGTITASGSGFRGGVNVNSGYVNGVVDYVSTSITQGGEKGEGIFGYQVDYDLNGGRYCRGAAANGGGGGNSTNAAGGGGGNGFNGNVWSGEGVMIVNSSNPITGWMLDPGYISNSNTLTNSSGGGRGGYSWAAYNGNAYVDAPGTTIWGGDNRREVGGLGGRPLTNINSESRIYFGGGGGAGHMNDNGSNSGTDGGGIIYLISNSVTGVGVISSNGLDVPASFGVYGDGNGGAGAGGSIVIKSMSISNTQNSFANGGQGGTQSSLAGLSSESEGGTGGGGGGFIASSVLVSSTVNGGPNGITLSPSLTEMPSNGATQGATGQVGIVTTNFVSYIAPLYTVMSNTPCIGSSLNFTCSAASTYTWTGPNGFTSFNQNPTIANTSTLDLGIYSVTLGFSGNCSSPITLTLNVSAAQAPTVTVSRDTSICAGAQITLTANGATSYTWNPGGITGNTFTVSPLVTMSYTVNAMSTGSCIASAVSTATVNPALPLSVNSGTICVGNSFVLNPLGASSYTYSGGSATVTPNVSTTYTITGANAVGCPGTIVSSVVVVPQPSLTVNSGSICSGNSFTITPNGASSYTFSGGASVVSPTTSTTYSIVGTSTLGCLVTNTVISSITVFPLPVLSVNSGTVCEGTPFAIVPNGASSYTYSSGSSIVSPTVSSTYSVTGSNTSGCVGVVISSVTVIPNPVIAITSNTTSVCSGENTFLNSSGATSYTWSTGQNTASITVNPITSNTYAVVGSYQVGALVCSATQTLFITVNSTLPISVNSGTICTGNSFTLNPLGASSYTYSSGSATVTPNVSTTYTITGSNAVGCTGTVTPSVVVVPQPTLAVNSGSICTGTSFTIMPNGASSYTYSGGVSVVSPTTSTTYSIIGTSTLGCLVTDTVISSVSVFPVPVLSVNSGTVCEGTTFTMVPSGAISYSYSSGSSVVSPTLSSTYSVTGSNTSGCVGVVISTVTVIPKPVIVITSTTTALCSGESTNLNATGATSYTWSTGQNTNSILITPTNSTIYSVVGSNQIGTFICSATQLIPITVTPQTTVAVFGQDSICGGSSTIIYATGATTYSWQPNASVSNPKLSHTAVNPISTTIYTVTASNNGACSGTGTIQINVNPLPIVYAGRDTTINIDQSYVLHGIGNVTVGFLSPDITPLICNFCPIVEVYPKTTTCYLLQGSNSHNCMAYDEICVQVTKDWDVYIPNTFTPNGDDLNDSFLPVGYGVSNITLSVFDRWGKEIFQSNPPVIGWNGKLNDQLCEQGTYVYQVEITTMSGLTIHKTGHVNLLGQLVK